MIFKERPEDFSPKFEVVSCFVEYDIGKVQKAQNGKMNKEKN